MSKTRPTTFKLRINDSENTQCQKRFISVTGTAVFCCNNARDCGVFQEPSRLRDYALFRKTVYMYFCFFTCI